VGRNRSILEQAQAQLICRSGRPPLSHAFSGSTYFWLVHFFGLKIYVCRYTGYCGSGSAVAVCRHIQRLISECRNCVAQTRVWTSATEQKDEECYETAWQAECTSRTDVADSSQ
jgi:hypothetical protein